jgi:hypothetical protein
MTHAECTRDHCHPDSKSSWRLMVAKHLVHAPNHCRPSPQTLNRGIHFIPLDSGSMLLDRPVIRSLLQANTSQHPRRDVNQPGRFRGLREAGIQAAFLEPMEVVVIIRPRCTCRPAVL